MEKIKQLSLKLGLILLAVVVGSYGDEPKIRITTVHGVSNENNCPLD